MQLPSALALLTTTLCFIGLPAPATAIEYCFPDGGLGHPYCLDGTRVKGACCGVGPCNIFCANCDGGCRKPRPASAPGYQHQYHAAAADTFEAFARAKNIDTGELTLRQYTQYMGVAADDPVYVDWFRRHDRNHDGVITLDELRLDGRSEL